MAVPRTRALAGRPAVLHDDVTELGSAAGRAAVGPAVQDQPSPDAGAQREHDEIARTAPDADRPFGDRGGVTVVVELDRKRKPLGELLPDGHARERDVHGGERLAGALVDHRGESEPEGGDAVALVEE